jgi:hypothetical protein
MNKFTKFSQTAMFERLVDFINWMKFSLKMRIYEPHFFQVQLKFEILIPPNRVLQIIAPCTNQKSAALLFVVQNVTIFMNYFSEKFNLKCTINFRKIFLRNFSKNCDIKFVLWLTKNKQTINRRSNFWELTSIKKKWRFRKSQQVNRVN